MAGITMMMIITTTTMTTTMIIMTDLIVQTGQTGRTVPSGQIVPLHNRQPGQPVA
jgi:hypothetical protein